jgi:Protein of unknown function (DUF736)
MIIGSFTKLDEGYTGSLETVTLSVKARITSAKSATTTPPTSLSAPANMNLVPLGSGHRAPAANTSRSSSMTRPSRLRSSLR